MEVRIRRKDMKKLLEKYYKDKEDFDGVITIRCSLGIVGYGIAETDGAEVEVKLDGYLNVMGIMVPMKRTLSEEEVKGAISSILDDAGYQVTNVSYEKGISSAIEGYGLGEHTVKRPYFNGAVAKVAIKTLSK